MKGGNHLMKIKFLGPSSAINVGVDGNVIIHSKGQIIDYPDEVGKDLLRAPKNNFEAVEKSKSVKNNAK